MVPEPQFNDLIRGYEIALSDLRDLKKALDRVIAFYEGLQAKAKRHATATDRTAAD
jgi:hypothetical protein